VSNVPSQAPPVNCGIHGIARAAATAAMASEQMGAPAQNAGALEPGAQAGRAATPRKPRAGWPARTSCRRSPSPAYASRRYARSKLKRLAPSIQDSISAESIGQLPDVTITDALQRITGVQIDRDAGVGTTVNVRGLPQVGTMLNGEVFITPDQIDSQQPDFTTLPATLFNQVDVIKSPTAGQTEGGISGSINLHTYRPWDLPHGFTYSYSGDGERGATTRKTGPEASGLASFNDDGRWGLLVSADFSDTTRMNATEGLDQYGVIFNGENAASAGAYNGFLGAWNGAPIPSKITAVSEWQCRRER
jgi:TonB-dependent receptor